MKNFGYSSFRLGESSLETRFIYSLFLLLVGGGLCTTWIFQFYKIGFSYHKIVTYYVGGEMDGRMFFAKNFNVLLEETHFHTFTMSVVFLILAHLTVATTIPRRLKIILILLGFFSTLFDIGGLWLVRYVSPLYAYVLMAAWIGLWLSYVPMISIPLYDMWFRPARR